MILQDIFDDIKQCRYYGSLLNGKVCDALKEKRRGKLSCRVLFHQDNVLAHTSYVAMSGFCAQNFAQNWPPCAEFGVLRRIEDNLPNNAKNAKNLPIFISPFTYNG